MKHSYLLDDPLSAVDAHVGRSLFRNCIRGLLRSKCVLLVTHALEYLPACDNIVVIEKGMIQDQGSYTHVSANQNGVLAGLLKAQKEAKAQSVSPITPLSPLSPIESEGVEKLQSDSVSTSMMIGDQTGTTDGVIQIEELTMRYRPELEPVLKHLNLHIDPGEKVGVVGRTGAGKSSLVLCLMRIIELESGRIVIDGVDIKQLELEDLRSHIAIIPQEPLLFSGMVRSNLDPFSEYSDESIWSALDRASMQTVISEAPAGLDTPVEEHGSNYSVGQR